MGWELHLTMVKKILMNKDGKKYLVKDAKKDLHTEFGYFKKQDLKKKGNVKTNMGTEFSIFDANFMDVYRRIKRGAQIIPLKDIGLILTETGIGKKSKVVDAGSGSGAVSCFIANLVKEVFTYEIREDFFKIVEHNIKLLGLKNINLKLQDIYKKIDEEDVDLVLLDLPEPWLAIKNAEKALKVGGFLVSYSPTLPQVMDFVEKVRENKKFSYIKTAEITERNWDVDGRKVRPKSQAIGHSGFLTFSRKIG